MSQYTPKTAVPDLPEARIAIVTAEWNGHITSRLAEGAIETLKVHKVKEGNITTVSVPGTIELTYGATRFNNPDLYDAIIVFGVVIRGDTPHFDYVCQSVTQGVTMINAKGMVPVIFGVLTVENEQQALDRVGGPAGHKGIEAAETALKMISLS